MFFRTSRSESPAMILFPIPKSVVIRGRERFPKEDGINPFAFLLSSSFDCSNVFLFDCSIVSPFLLPSVFPVRYSYFAGWKYEFSHWSSFWWGKVVKVVFHSGSKTGRNIASPLILLLLLLSFHCWIVLMFNCSNVFPLLPSVLPVRDSYFAGGKYEFSPW